MRTTFSKRSDKILDCAVHLCSFSRSTYGTRYLFVYRELHTRSQKISRRGRPFTIYSDNGKNLVGTSNELKNIDWKKVNDYGSLKKINWKLNPPFSPWWWWWWWGVSGNGL
ncbi:integrase catalytic domain-containing protein [Trichonephila clavipes]|nr:integrase catalytic domain-containing protein [Trichonephila clavipes]